MSTPALRIIKAEAQIWTDDVCVTDAFGLHCYVEQTVGETLWLTTEDGATYGVDPLKGETLADLIARYPVGGEMDDRPAFLIGHVEGAQ